MLKESAEHLALSYKPERCSLHKKKGRPGRPPLLGSEPLSPTSSPAVGLGGERSRFVVRPECSWGVHSRHSRHCLLPPVPQRVRRAADRQVPWLSSEDNKAEDLDVSVTLIVARSRPRGGTGRASASVPREHSHRNGRLQRTGEACKNEMLWAASPQHTKTARSWRPSGGWYYILYTWSQVEIANIKNSNSFKGFGSTPPSAVQAPCPNAPTSSGPVCLQPPEIRGSGSLPRTRVPARPNWPFAGSPAPKRRRQTRHVPNARNVPRARRRNPACFGGPGACSR